MQRVSRVITSMVDLQLNGSGGFLGELADTMYCTASFRQWQCANLQTLHQTFLYRNYSLSNTYMYLEL